MHRLSSGPMTAIGRVAVVLMLCSAFAAAQSSPHGPLKQVCADCHTTTSWKELAAPMKFTHATTGFSLQGAHGNLPCLQCHTTKRFVGTASDCYSCHAKDYAKAATPDHRAGQFSHDCASCHTFNSWRPSEFEHAKTNFQLTGAHASVQCADCHVNNRYKGLPNDCFYCHKSDYAAAKEPDHAKAQVSHDCLTCHSVTGWKPSTFDHQRTAFPLTGSHASLACASCHTNGQFKGKSQECYSCHQKDYAKVVQPNHVTAQFDHNCVTCHTVNTWTPSTFDHQRTEFRLTGAHTAAECSGCHTGGVFKGTAKECYPCHRAEMEKVVTPDHVKGQFSHDCLTCHTNMVWKPATFDHNRTNYPLAGAHKSVDCAKCHTNEKYKGLPSDCYSCHATTFNKTETPPHLAGQFSHDCMTCHTVQTWRPSTFNHAKTAFPLKGAHVSVDCASCHSNGQFATLTMDCYGCHRNDFASAKVPDHVIGQFSHDCLTCHANTAWKPAKFNHSQTNFPLTGAHVSVTCASCHKNGQFTGTSTDCYSCHQSQFNTTVSPNHATGQFSHDCLTCHTTSVWKPSTFNHSTTAFPLTGAHVAVGCGDCHKNGQFKGTAKDCYTCHLSDFNGVTDPNHLTNAFDHNCLSCHTVTAWSPATFNHSATAFPLTGAHSSTTCVKCHVGGKYAGTSKECYVCHKTDYDASTNPNHVTGKYSTTCTTCHNTSVWQPWIFNHNTYFTINSNHNGRAKCADCHRVAGSFTSFSCTTGCHSSAHRKNQACWPCHKR